MNSLDANIWSEAYDLSVPFTVPLANQQSLVCNQVVRAMPGRRYVCRGTYDAKPVFIKLFAINGRAKREWEKEQQGINILLQAGIPAPSIVYFEASPALATRVVVFTELLGAESAKFRWENGNETSRQMLLMQLVELMAQHHAAGIRQADCHLLNFVFSEDVLYTLDAADIVKSPSALSRLVSMQGLTDMLALFPAEYDRLLPTLYEYYCKCRDFPVDAIELEKLGKDIDKVRQYKLDKYLEKTYRNCSAFSVTHNWNHFSIIRREVENNDLRLLARSPDIESECIARSIIKDGNTCTVSLLETPQHKIVCKRYNIKSVWHGLMRAFRASRASRSWRNAYRLHKFAIATPLPLAMVEQRLGPIRRRAWLFMPYVDGVSAYHAFRDEDKSSQQLDELAGQFVALFKKMQQARLSHGDMKSTNFIFSDNELVVIDLDSMRQHGNESDFARAFAIDIQRFFQNWQELPQIMALFAQHLSSSSLAEYLPTGIKG